VIAETVPAEKRAQSFLQVAIFSWAEIRLRRFQHFVGEDSCGFQLSTTSGFPAKRFSASFPVEYSFNVPGAIPGTHREVTSNVCGK
jgi:hypothetical protein